MLVLILFPADAGAAKAAWVKAPVLPALSHQDQAKLKVRVARGDRLGLRSRVFAKVGDSNTEFSPNFYGLGCRAARGLGPALQRTLRRWNQVRVPNLRALPGCRPWTSFSRRSSAAQAGVYSFWSVTLNRDLPTTGYTKRSPGCSLNRTPLDCEIAATRPRYATVMLGTNDIGMDLYFGFTPGSQIGQRVGAVARALLKQGVVPVLSTIPPVRTSDPALQEAFDKGVRRSNAEVWKLSRRLRLPMINFWRALRAPALINRGLADDGLHLTVKGAGSAAVGVSPGRTLADSVDFRPGALRFGANRRNLIWLRTLARLDKITG